MILQHKLNTSLAELLLAAQARNPVPFNTGAPHAVECRLLGAQEVACQGVSCAIHTVTSWAAGTATVSNSTPAPQRHLLMLVSALSDASHPSSDNTTISALANSCKALTQAAVQLCSAASASAACMANIHAASSSSHSPASSAAAAAAAGCPVSSSSQLELQQRQGQPDAAVGTEGATEQFRCLLFWSCHLTTALHKFVSIAQATSTPLPGRRKTAAQSTPTTSGPAPSMHSLPPQLQQRWAHKSLPACLQHLLTCYQQLVGATGSSTGSSAAATPSCSQPGMVAAVAGRQQPTAGILHCCLLVSTKQQSSMDQLLYGTCLAILDTTNSAHITTQPRKSRAGSKSGRPPAKHARKAAAPDNTSGPTVSLTPKCSELLASCIGCHLLFRHQQQLASKSGSKQPGGSSSSSSSWVWCEEAARMLADPQQQHLHPLLTPAIMSLLHHPSTRTAACTMLCTAAGSISGATAAVGETGRQPGKHAASAGTAATAAVVNSQSSMLLLDLLAGLLTSQWPTEWVCQAPAVPQAAEAEQMPAQPEDDSSTAEASLSSCRLTAAAANSAQHKPAQDAAAAAAAAVLALPPDALQQLLAASLLPQLQPLATLCKAAAARKHWLSIAATAAAPPPPLPYPTTTAAAGVRGSVLPSTSAAVECAAASGQAAGLFALAAAAASDRDATVRAKSLTLLQQAAPHLLQAWQHCSRSKHQSPQPPQQQQQQPGAGGAAGAPCSEVFSGLRTAAAAVVTAICSQLLGSSKASRLKALLLLQRLLQPVSAATGTPEQMQGVQELQQQLVLVTFPAVCSILTAGDDSTLCCPNCKTAAAELLPAMAAVLQPQQALQLALSHCSRTVSGTVRSTVSTHEQGQTRNRQQDPAALLLVPLAQCSAQQLYEHLQQQLPLPPRTCSIADAAVAGAADGSPASPPTAHSSSSSSSQRPGLPPAARRPVMAQLQQLMGGLQSQQGLRQHAFIQACQALAVAADAATDGSTTLEHQLVLLQGMQLLQVCGGCSARSAGDMRAELAILVDATDLCCSWLASEGSVPAAAAADAAAADAATAAADIVMAGGPSSSAGQLSQRQQQQGTQPELAAGKPTHACEVALPVCRELLRTILCILGSALSTAATAAAAAADKKSGVALPAGAAAAAVGHDVWCSQWMWGEVGACLMHHLEAVVSYSSSSSSMGGGSAPLPVSTLDKYLEVLCKTNRHQQLLLHELLATWHKQLAQGPPAAAAAARGSECKDTASAAAAAAAAEDNTADARLVAFLLLLKHLAGFYALEQASFKQRVVTAMTAASKGLSADGGSTAAAAGADTDRQQQQGFDYMCGEEEAACVEASTARFTADLLAETAPACYLPLLLQLVGVRGAPTHVKVLALQALEPLLLVSPHLSSRHSSTLAALLTDTHAPPALLLQTVSTTGAIISRRPAESSLLVAHLEQLLLAAIAGSSGTFTSSSSSGSNGAGGSGSAGGGGGSRSGSGDSNMQEAGTAAGRRAGAATAPAPAAAVAAARCYCRLLLGEKLLLTGHSWGIVAHGLLATGTLQDVATSMQHLLAALTQQQRMPRCKVALDLVLNFSTPVQAATSAAVPSCSTASARATASDGGVPASSSTAQQEVSCAQAEALVQQLLRLVLTPKELSSESLMLPLLEAVAMAASSSWTGAKSSSSTSSKQWGSAAQGSTAAAAAAALLAACTPSGRCLEVLLRTCQAHKHSMALHCSSSVVSHLATFVRSYGSSSSAPSRAQQSAAAKEPEVGSSSRKAVGAQHAAMQQQLLRLLQGMRASAAADVGAHQPQQDAVFGVAALSAAAAAAAAAAAEAASDGEGDWEQQPSAGRRNGRVLRGAAAKPGRGGAGGSAAAVTGCHQLAGDRAAADAVGVVVTGVKRRSGASKSSSSVLDAHALQQLLRERQQDMVQLKALMTS